MEFDKVAFNMAVDTLSDVVKTPFGYHIIKVSEHTPSTQLGFKEVSAQIQKQLLARRQQERVRAFLEDISKKADIEVKPELLKKAAP